MPEQAPLVHTMQVQVDAAATGAEGGAIIGQADVAGTVTAVRYITAAAITGANTNTRKVDVINKGQAGAGTTVVATKQFDSTVNAAAFDETALTLSVVTGATTVAVGDTLAFVSTHVGTGLADPGGTVAVDITRS